MASSAPAYDLEFIKTIEARIQAEIDAVADVEKERTYRELVRTRAAHLGSARQDVDRDLKPRKRQIKIENDIFDVERAYVEESPTTTDPEQTEKLLSSFQARKSPTRVTAKVSHASPSKSTPPTAVNAVSGSRLANNSTKILIDISDDSDLDGGLGTLETALDRSPLSKQARYVDASTPSASKRTLTATSASRDGKRSGVTDISNRRKSSTTSSLQTKGCRDDDKAPSEDPTPPVWYLKIPKNPPRGRNESNVDTLLRNLKEQINSYKNIGGCKPEAVGSEISDQVHKLAFQVVNPVTLRRNRILDNEHGLPSLFAGPSGPTIAWKQCLEDDARELYNKWCRGIFETNLLRGIIPGNPTSSKESGARNNDKIDWDNPKGVVSFRNFGTNGLINGQWFPTQLCTIRDGAHGSSQGGISGKKGEGAYSVIMTGTNNYPDRDEGGTVYYCGTDGTYESVTADTQLLLDGLANKKPVRLIRSANLKQKKSPYAPELGYRYDGLYDIMSVEKLDLKLARHQFRLIRRAGQGEIRYVGPMKRPTVYEVEEYKKDQHFRGY